MDADMGEELPPAKSMREQGLEQELASAHAMLAHQQAEIGALRAQVSRLETLLRNTYGESEY